MNESDLRAKGFIRQPDGSYGRPAASARTVSLPIVQDAKASDNRPAHGKAATDNKPKTSGVDGKVHPKFRVTITMRYSDNRPRDLDGGSSTILDCLIRAVRRLSPVDTGDSHSLRGGSQR